MSTARRAAVGFQGGQVLTLRIAEDQLSELRKALAQLVQVLLGDPQGEHLPSLEADRSSSRRAHA